MLRLYKTENLTTEVHSCVENFTYLGKVEKTIFPFQSSIQEIFDILVTKAINSFTLGNFIGVSIRENINSEFSYTIITRDTLDLEGYKAALYDGVRSITDVGLISLDSSGFSIDNQTARMMFHNETVMYFNHENSSHLVCIDFHTKRIESKIKKGLRCDASSGIK
jgi:hypothetical protein